VRFLWGSVAVSPTCGVSVGLAEAPDLPGRPGPRASRYCNLCMLVIILRVIQRGRDSPPARGGSAPAEYARGFLGFPACSRRVSDPTAKFATPRIAAGAMFVDRDRILLVHKTYGNGWDIPSLDPTPLARDSAAARKTGTDQASDRAARRFARPIPLRRRWGP
jgi:hypothetical protein